MSSKPIGVILLFRCISETRGAGENLTVYPSIGHRRSSARAQERIQDARTEEEKLAIPPLVMIRLDAGQVRRLVCVAKITEFYGNWITVR